MRQAALVLIVSAHPKAMPLCFKPRDHRGHHDAGRPVGGVDNLLSERGPAGAIERRRRDRQRARPAGRDLAAVFAIRKVRGSATPYDVPIALAVLKVPSGALTAVTGILLLGGGFVPGFSELDSQRQILAYALLFGYAQQLGTRFIDDRAKAIVNSLPSEDPEGKRPQPSLGSTTSRPAAPGADPAS
jgi:hypothetical protein